MARYSGSGAEQVYGAAKTWVERGLKANSSLFTPERAIWARAPADELHERFVLAPDVTGESFEVKLAKQLDGASPEAIQLMAELLYVHLLPAQKYLGKTKRGLVRSVLGGLPDPVDLPDDLDRALDYGLLHEGMYFKTGRYWLLCLLIEFVRAWKALDANARAGLLVNPWDFKAMLTGVKVKRAKPQRHALLHLVHPDTFECIVSERHKTMIAAAFADRVDKPAEDLDRRLLQIRQTLQANQDEPVHFYRDPLKSVWNKGGDGGNGGKTAKEVIERLLPEGESRHACLEYLARSIERAHSLGGASWDTTLFPDHVRLNVGRNQAFILKPNRIHVVVDQELLEDPEEIDGIDVIGTDQYKILPMAIDLEIAASRVAEVFPQVEPACLALIDASVAKTKRTPWLKSHSPEVVAYLSEALGRELPTPNVAEETTLGGLEASLYLKAGSLDRIARLLDDKMQVIFYGPPGTGKTYVAKQLAEHFVGPNGTVEVIQFHPSYAYEDFVEGFRPGPEGFRLVDGPLKRLALKAVQNPDATHVLIIDEINRGNLAKVFGELYFLLEYREENITLQYSDRRFALPRNLWIIGTMNTADRSIALVDLALRRRFHFAPFYPDQAPIEGLLRRWLRANNSKMEWVADVVDRANKLLGDRHVAIGPSYFLREDLDGDWLDLIWEHSVLPYLAEHFFGDEERLNDFQLAKLRGAS